jgi:hypothetical protein|tara:strand:- start:644 stop:835 length:192 start_codon:yes stop_codon:yes gene_type:complete
MDIQMALQELGLVKSNEYTITQSNAPNAIDKWFGPDPQPTEDELNTAWASFVSKNPDWDKSDI